MYSYELIMVKFIKNIATVKESRHFKCNYLNFTLGKLPSI